MQTGYCPRAGGQPIGFKLVDRAEDSVDSHSQASFRRSRRQTVGVQLRWARDDLLLMISTAPGGLVYQLFQFRLGVFNFSVVPQSRAHCLACLCFQGVV